MKEPKKIKLTDSPICKSVNLIPLPSVDSIYPETMSDDVNTLQEINKIISNKDSNQNNSINN
jgi:hypothetical protein